MEAGRQPVPPHRDTLRPACPLFHHHRPDGLPLAEGQRPDLRPLLEPARPNHLGELPDRLGDDAPLRPQQPALLIRLGRRRRLPLLPLRLCLRPAQVPRQRGHLPDDPRPPHGPGHPHPHTGIRPRSRPRPAEHAVGPHPALDRRRPGLRHPALPHLLRHPPAGPLRRRQDRRRLARSSSTGGSPCPSPGRSWSPWRSCTSSAPTTTSSGPC